MQTGGPDARCAVEPGGGVARCAGCGARTAPLAYGPRCRIVGEQLFLAV